MTEPLRAGFAIPGDLSAPTGGYGYARALMAAGPRAGLALAHLPLPGGFPFPDAGAVAESAAALASAPADRPLLVDGLAFGALPEAALAAASAPLAALLHHPLALEAGLAPERAAALEASEGAALRHARAVVTTSHATAARAVEMFGLDAATVTVAPPGLDRGPRAALAGDPPRILCVGTLTPRKAQDVLLDALGRLADRPWTLDLAGMTGDAAFAAALRAAAGRFGDRVRFHGGLPRAALDALYAQADIFCLPSLYEGYGMAYAEAMARGLPVVAARHAASEEVIGPAGRLAPPGDAAALAGALSTLLDDPAARRRAGDAAAARAENFPDWVETAGRVRAALAAIAPG